MKSIILSITNCFLIRNPKQVILSYLKIYEDACHEIFYQISKYLSEEVLEKKLEGPIKQMGFSRLT